MGRVRANRSFDADTHRQDAASRVRKHTSCGHVSVNSDVDAKAHHAVKRMDNVGIVGEDLEAAIEFFTDLGR